ncbi:hypothetical protein OG453_21300 [Streptomyces sp. NBC_01381]|uniref:hypothetical protein n=1 Tax=Streptomyces sp. NBC_01381 TaxID=2903845 RepID=UPI002256F75E|nr:hypothetical protein [Streptomyces sp. NBC_01381]MCX4669177.1 hypothetical protein [Streptomyces sp. NBC_01381]
MPRRRGAEPDAAREAASEPQSERAPEPQAVRAPAQAPQQVPEPAHATQAAMKVEPAHAQAVMKAETAPEPPPPGPVLTAAPVAEADGEGPLPVVSGLIDVLDRVAVLRGRPAGVPLDASVLDWLEQSVLRMLADCDVRPYEGEGELDPQRHESVLSEPAPRPELINHVATNLRPGYLWRTEPVRPAQVTVYVAAKRGAGDD